MLRFISKTISHRMLLDGEQKGWGKKKVGLRVYSAAVAALALKARAATRLRVSSILMICCLFLSFGYCILRFNRAGGRSPQELDQFLLRAKFKRPARVYFFHAAREFGTVLRSVHSEPHHKCSLHYRFETKARSNYFREESVEFSWSLRDEPGV